MDRSCQTCEFYSADNKECRIDPPEIVLLYATGGGSENHMENGNEPLRGNTYSKNYTVTLSQNNSFNHTTQWPKVKEHDWCGKYQPNYDLAHLIEVVQEDVNEQRKEVP